MHRYYEDRMKHLAEDGAAAAKAIAEASVAADFLPNRLRSSSSSSLSRWGAVHVESS